MTPSLIALSVLTVAAVFVVLGVKIVPQTQAYVVESFGRFSHVLRPGLHFVWPVFHYVAHRVDVRERQLPDYPVEAITKDNTPLSATASTFYRVTNPELRAYRIADVDRAIMTAVTGAVRALIGGIEFDDVQSNRATISAALRDQLAAAAEEWGVEITRSEILSVDVDEDTRRAIQMQLNAERTRRAAVTTAEGEKTAAQLRADAELYAAQRQAEARRVAADADAYAAQTVAAALKNGGMDAMRYEIARTQVAAVSALAAAPSAKVVMLPSDAAQALSGVAGFASMIGLQSQALGEDRAGG